MKPPVRNGNAARLLDAEVGPDYLAQQARRYAQQKQEAKPGAHAVVVFRVGREWLALPATLFREIAALRPVHSLPHRRERVVAGVANIRGALVLCVSLAEALGIGAEPPGAAARLAVVSRGEDTFVFTADEVAGLHRYDAADLLPLPATLAHAQAVHTRGVLAWQGRAVGVLDDELLFHSLNRHLA